MFVNRFLYNLLFIFLILVSITTNICGGEGDQGGKQGVSPLRNLGSPVQISVPNSHYFDQKDPFIFHGERTKKSPRTRRILGTRKQKEGSSYQIYDSSDTSWKTTEGSIFLNGTDNGTEVVCVDGHGALDLSKHFEKEEPHNELWKQPWAPEKGKFLLPFCYEGKTTNHVRCLHGALLLAGLLNRTLIVPLRGTDLVGSVDVGYIEKCFGSDTAISLQNYVKKFGGPAVVSDIICVDLCHNKSNKTKNGQRVFQLGLRRNFFADARFAENVRLWKRPGRGPQDAKSLLKSYGNIGEGIVYVHTPVYSKVLDAPYVRLTYPVDAPFKRRGICTSKISIQPPEPLITAAREYVRNHFRGRKFVAVHLRMGDFEGYCKHHHPKCYYSVRETSACLMRQMKRVGFKQMFVASNGKGFEIRFLRQKVSSVSNFTTFSLKTEDPRDVTLMENLRISGYDLRKSVYRIVFDKLVCAHSLIFLGSVSSSFSRDIMRLRHGFGTATCADDYYCGPPDP